MRHCGRMLEIPPKEDLADWCRDLVDACMGSAQDRGAIYSRATMYYYNGSWDARAAIYNKIKGFVDKLSGFLMQPTDIRFSIVFDSSEPESVLERAQLVSEKLTADFKQTDSDVQFAEAVVWSLVNGCSILKVAPNFATNTFSMYPVHPQNFGVLSETTLDLHEQEAFCHVSYPTISRVDADLAAINHPRRKAIIEQLL